jgi:hypothetical protein
MARGVKGSGPKPATKPEARIAPQAAERVALHEDNSPPLTKCGWIQTLSPMKQQAGDRKTTLTVNGHIYVFTRNKFDDYVAEVPFPEDYHAILSIGAGYKPYEAPRPRSNSRSVRRPTT